MTAFGWNDAGGGTAVPRAVAKELARRGWEVTVFHAAVPVTASRTPYELTEWDEDGVHLIGVHNRPSVLFDIQNPLRELDDPAITQAFARVLDATQPDVVHFHNLHNLGAALIDEVATRGLPSFFTTHNYWLICPRAYLLTGAGEMCPGPGDGSRCAACTGGFEAESFRQRLRTIRAQAQSSLTRILAVSDAVRRTLLATGYDPALVDVVRQAMPHEDEIWEQLGRDRKPGRHGERLTVAFVGSAYPHKGPQLLVSAAQRTRADVRVKIVGEVQDTFAARLRELDTRGVVELTGSFDPSQIAGLLADVDAAVLPSLWWDCAPLVASECKAARLPLLVPRFGGLPETVRDGIDGLTFAGGDADDLARQLDRLADTDLLASLQRAIEPPRAFADYVDELERYYRGERPSPAAPTLTPTQIGVRWQGEHGQPTSLSIINDQIISRLPGPVERTGTDRGRVGAPAPYASAVEVRQQWPPDLSAPRAGALAAIVPWEFGSVPAEWVDQIQRNVDELWVPSEFVRQMYVDDGVDPERVQVIPNGVDLELFTPAPSDRQREDGITRFLFVGGVIPRKGPDLLLRAYISAFAGREDVLLTVKDFGADGIYRDGDRHALRAHAESGRLPRIELIERELPAGQLVDLYQSADVLVHPYRGEGFGMPVLEAMACGLPVIVTAGGPTDEFCPPEAGWRIRSQRRPLVESSVSGIRTVAEPWLLEPDVEHLVALLREAAAHPGERRRRGLAARRAAERLSWDAVAARYRERLTVLANRPTKLAHPPVEPFPFEEDVDTRVLTTPAWRGVDELPALLQLWSSETDPTDSACLYLLADPATAGTPDEVEAAVVRAAQRGGADLNRCADINVLMERFTPERDRRLLASVDAYVTLHPGADGYARLATDLGCPAYAATAPALAELLDRAVHVKAPVSSAD